MRFACHMKVVKLRKAGQLPNVAEDEKPHAEGVVLVRVGDRIFGVSIVAAGGS